jgi:diguanylate cyclase (GGDEF)-like protein/PAS domain S-box-containing protein
VSLPEHEPGPDERPTPSPDAGYFGRSGSGDDQAERLRELESRYRGVIDHLPAVIYVDGVADGAMMVDVSPGIRELLGIEPREWIENYLAWEDRIHPDDRERVVAASDRSVATGEPFSVEYRALHADGHVVWIKEDSVLIHDDDGNPMHWLGVMLDVTELVETQQDLREVRTTYGALVEQIPAIVYRDLADESWTTAYVSPQIREILGVDPSEWTGESKLWLEMLHPDDRQRALEEVDQGIASGEPYAVEYRMIARDGRTVWFRDGATVLHDDEGVPTMIQGVMLDITERRNAEERLAFLAYHDRLTGLPNKAMFDELLELSLARASRHRMGCAVLAVDVDNFKLVNDSLGHEAGDRLISLLAERIREATRETDLVAREGGDEFLLLLSDLERTSPVSDGDGATIVAESVANRVLRALHDPFTIDGTELYVSASIGISVYPGDADDAGQLLRNADGAMFRAKAAGPGAYVTHQIDDADALTKLSLSTRLRKAVEQKAWALHYQPLVDLLSGEMVGVEALIRWPDPNGGLVPPGEFIPLAEEMGLIEAIGDWVVEEICRQDAEWRADGLTLDIGFNLSPRELWQMDPVERIVDRITRAGMEPGRVTIEITESTAMNDPDRIVDLLHRFHDAGLRLAIDDFGTGYSSLSRLRYMPVEILKIDRTFVREVHSDPQSASMVSAIIALASNLGMESLAEGIETEAEWRFLADRGCPLGQGDFFSRPVAPEEILAQHRRAGLTIVDGRLAG